jgi:hypothetical protein
MVQSPYETSPLCYFSGRFLRLWYVERKKPPNLALESNDQAASLPLYSNFWLICRKGKLAA